MLPRMTVEKMDSLTIATGIGVRPGSFLTRDKKFTCGLGVDFCNTLGIPDFPDILYQSNLFISPEMQAQRKTHHLMYKWSILKYGADYTEGFLIGFDKTENYIGIIDPVCDMPQRERYYHGMEDGKICREHTFNQVEETQVKEKELCLI